MKNRKGENFDGVSDPAFSPDGTKLSRAACPEQIVEQHSAIPIHPSHFTPRDRATLFLG
jgi:hypothetical protein